MPGTITTDLITINDAEATTNWFSSGGANLGTNDDLRIQGSFCLAARVSNTTMWLGAPDYITGFTADDKHVFVWYRSVTPISDDTKANGGRVIWISSDQTPTITGVSPDNAPTNSKNWRVDGSDTEKLGIWTCYVVDPNGTADFTTGTTNLASIRRIGARKKTVSAVATSNRDFTVDSVRIGTGLYVTGGTSGSPVQLTDIFSTDSSSSNAYGVVTSVSGVYYLAGKIRMGSATQFGSTVFSDSSQLCVFKNYPVANNFYEFVVTGNSSYGTTFQLGQYVSGLASSGCTIRGAAKLATDSNPSVKAFAMWTLDGSFSGATVKLYGSNFSELRRATLNGLSEVRYCSFTNFGDITPNGCVMDNCTFQNVVTATTTINGSSALVISSSGETSVITNCSFINCNKAIRILSAGTYTFSGLTFNGNTYDVENASSGAVTIECVNDSDASTYINTSGGTTTISNPITLTFTDLQENTEVRIYRVSDDVELSGIENSTTAFQYNYNYAGDVDVYVRIHHVQYEPISMNLTLSSSNNTIPIQQRYDRNYSNP